MIPFGLRGGQLVSINDVERGIQKDVFCPVCGSPLIARKGMVRAHYFAHSTGFDCSAALQTVLHMRAKEIIAEEKSIFIPEYSIKLQVQQKPFNIIKSQKVDLDDVWIEKRLGKIIPDVFAKALNKELLIEIRVSHAVDKSKIDLIKHLNLRAIEVDLSDLLAKRYDDDVLRERIVEQHDRKKWLSSPKINDLTEDVLIATIHRTVPWLSAFSGRCPVIKGLPRYANGPACVICEYYFGYKGEAICCGYNDKINDYDSLQRSVKRKNSQP